MNTEFTKQLAICNNRERKIRKCWNAYWFFAGTAVAIFLFGPIWLIYVLLLCWVITLIITDWHINKYGREVDKLGEMVGK